MGYFSQSDVKGCLLQKNELQSTRLETWTEAGDNVIEVQDSGIFQVGDTVLIQSSRDHELATVAKIEEGIVYLMASLANAYVGTSAVTVTSRMNNKEQPVPEEEDDGDWPTKFQPFDMKVQE